MTTGEQMQTPLILSPVSVNQQAAPTSKQADNTASKDLSFKQMLARQAANHSDAANSKKTSENTAKTSSDAVPKEGEKEIKKNDDIAGNPSDATTATTAELLALVANARQPAEKLDDTTDKAALLNGKLLGEDALPKVAGDPVIGRGKHTDPLSDRALLGNRDKQDLRNDDASQLVPDLMQSMSKKGDTRLSMDAVTATFPKNDSQSTTITANIAATQMIAQNVGDAAKNSISDTLTPAVGSNAWNQALGQKITFMIGATQQTATLSLNPPDLGPLQVILNISKDSADATFIATQPEVRQALEAALPRLREMMNEAGIALGQANVSSDMPNQNNAEGGSGNRMGTQTPQDNMDSEDAPTSLNTKRTIQQGLIDAFA